jgi:hypothetical protein
MKLFEMLDEFSRKKYAREAERIRKKQNASFMETIGLNPSTAYTTEQINDAIINYVTNNERLDVAYDIKLTDAQLNDANFMSRLYATNNASIIKYFKPVESLYSNHDHIIDYMKRYYQTDLTIMGPKLANFRNTMSLFRDELANTEFVERLIQEFPEHPIIHLTNDLLIRWNIDKERKQFNSIMSELSTEAVIAQASKFGKDATRYVPQKREDYKQIIEASIATDGFDTLTLLTPQQLLANKGLMLQAFDVANKTLMESQRSTKSKGLKQHMSPLTFFVGHNAPMQDRSYMCHGDSHSFSLFSKPHLEFQYRIANDPEFWDKANYPTELKHIIIQAIKDCYAKYMLDSSIIANPTVMPEESTM